MQGSLSHERNICPSVCQTRENVTCRKKLTLTFLYYKKDRRICCATQSVVGGGSTFYLKFWTKVGPALKNDDSQFIRLYIKGLNTP